jgi:hypothetical protein
MVYYSAEIDLFNVPVGFKVFGMLAVPASFGCPIRELLGKRLNTLKQWPLCFEEFSRRYGKAPGMSDA